MSIIDNITHIFRGEKRSLENAAVPLSSGFISLFGDGMNITPSGEAIGQHNAMRQVSTVYACIRCISESIASLPLELHERTSSGAVKAVGNDLYDLLAISPNPEMSAYNWIESMIASLLLSGNAYSQIQRNGVGQVVGIWPLSPLKTTVVRRDDGKLWVKTSDGVDNGSERYIPMGDVLHFRLFSLDGLVGISPIDVARNQLGLAAAQTKYSSRFFSNGATPSGVLMLKPGSVNTKPEKIQSAKEDIQASVAGINQHKTLVLSGDWDYKSIGVTPDQAQFLESRKMSIQEIAGLYKLSPYKLGLDEKLSGTNATQLNLEFLTNTLHPLLANLEAEIMVKLLPTVGRKANKYFVKFDVSQLLRADTSTQWTNWNLARQMGVASINDVRTAMGMQRINKPECDLLSVPANYMNAEKLLDQSYAGNMDQQNINKNSEGSKR
jgi:HK97 family phage portal protein